VAQLRKKDITVAEQAPKDDRQRSQSADEWGQVFRNIENQIRREAARAVGVPEDSDWKMIGRETDDAARRNVAKAIGMDENSEWDSIGRSIEEKGRSGIARFVGTSADSDWDDIGKAVETRVRTFLDDIFANKAKGKETTESEDLVDPWE